MKYIILLEFGTAIAQNYDWDEKKDKEEGTQKNGADDYLASY